MKARESLIVGLFAAGLLSASVDAGLAQTTEPAWRHGVALLGTPKYPPDFPHFDYVKPDAPKGGALRLGSDGTFDSFNLALSGLKGQVEEHIGYVYDTLTTAALDEVATDYGLIAEAIRFPADYSWVAFRLRPQARWHDGKPVTVDDVIFSFETLKKMNPLYSTYWRNVTKAERTGEHEVTFRFDISGNRELPGIMGQLYVLPKHWWEGTDASGKKRNIEETSLEPPLGSGPYRLKSFAAGRTAVYERVGDYWGRDLPVNRGASNFDEIRADYFRDSTVTLEAFKGDQIDYREENRAKEWATAYDFPAVREGRVIKETFPQKSYGIMQAFVFNLRRDRFKDERVRRAFNYAFDFESINRTLFSGQYKRIDSYFYGTELASSGLAEGDEKAILETVRDKVPPAVFTTPYRNPVNDTPEGQRDNLREAVKLLGEAGYDLKGGKLLDRKTGQPFTIEYLGYDASFERFLVPYTAALNRIGISVNARIVDPTQYQNRLRNFDFDVTSTTFTQSLSPGNEQREFWGSAAADIKGAQNYAGIKDPAIDALIERVIFAKSRPELVAATRALDRVLLAHHFMVPQWTVLEQRTIRWDRFGPPAKPPEYGASGFPRLWWYDKARAEKTGGGR